MCSNESASIEPPHPSDLCDKEPFSPYLEPKAYTPYKCSSTSSSASSSPTSNISRNSVKSTSPLVPEVADIQELPELPDIQEVDKGHFISRPQHHYPLETPTQHSSAFFSTTAPPSMSGLLPLDHYRLQLYNYAMVERLRNGGSTSYGTASQNNSMNFHPQYPPVVPGPYGPRLALSLFHNRVFQPEEPKPQHSYIGLIAMAILSTPDHKLVLSDIYQHILDNYPYFRARGPGWRNSIRHNLSLNDCFIKSGRSANGKGHYWAIHPANLDDFKKGDFRRRKAQRKVRKHMGLAVDEDGADSPSPPPQPISPTPLSYQHHSYTNLTNLSSAGQQWPVNAVALYSHASRKRQFDVASLLAPDLPIKIHQHQNQTGNPSSNPSKRLAVDVTDVTSNSVNSDLDEDIDVVANDDYLSAELPTIPTTEPSGEPPNLSDHNENICGPSSGAWSSFIQQLPLGVNVDPRILGRYYGQYMAAAQQHAASKRLLNLTTSLTPGADKVEYPRDLSLSPVHSTHSTHSTHKSSKEY